MMGASQPKSSQKGDEMDIFAFMGQMLPQETELGLRVLGIFSLTAGILTMILKKDIG